MTDFIVVLPLGANLGMLLRREEPQGKLTKRGEQELQELRLL